MVFNISKNTQKLWMYNHLRSCRDCLLYVRCFVFFFCFLQLIPIVRIFVFQFFVFLTKSEHYVHFLFTKIFYAAKKIYLCLELCSFVLRWYDVSVCIFLFVKIFVRFFSFKSCSLLLVVRVVICSNMVWYLYDIYAWLVYLMDEALV